jgi:membrane protein DedA with SNARE-associated domain
MGGWLEMIVNTVTGFIHQAGYGGVFLFMLLESLCLPIPSEIVLVSAGFLVAEGNFTLPFALLSGFAGALSGSSIAYSIARFGGRPLLARYGRYLFLTEARLAATEKWFYRHGAKAVFICRLISGMRAIISLPAGLCHMPYSKFLLYTALGSGLWVVTGTLFGMFVGLEWEKLNHLGHLVLAGVLGIAVLLLAWKHFHKTEAKASVAGTESVGECGNPSNKS